MCEVSNLKPVCDLYVRRKYFFLLTDPSYCASKKKPVGVKVADSETVTITE